MPPYDLSHTALPTTNFAASERPSSKAAFETLMVPNARRTLITLVCWSVTLSVYMRAMELQGMAPEAQYGLAVYLFANLFGGMVAWAISMSAWYAVAKPLWLRDASARQRYATEGMYALLPWRVMVPLSTTASLSGGALAYWAWLHCMDALHAWTPTLRNQTTLGNALVAATFSWTVLYSMDFVRVRLAMHRQRAETAHRLTVEAQLQRLQAQMEPHMLFNTLANLHALIETQPQKAQDMLTHLIDYLRATLSASRNGTLALGEEMQRVADYLALMQIRMGERLRVHVDVPGDMANLQVPPMIVQPLVENAIKHGLDPVPEGGRLTVRATSDGTRLCITVEDDGQGLRPDAQPPAQGGFGLSCIRARLQTTYGERARLDLAAHESGRGAIASLTLPIDGMAHASAVVAQPAWR